MKKTIRFALLLGICGVITPSEARAQWSPYPQRLPYPYSMMDNMRGALRVEVSPKEAEVYVDGYYAGIVDDFDGAFQRLRVTPGAHEIIVRRDGFHGLKEDVYVTPDMVYRIRRRLEPLQAGEANEPRPTPQAPQRGGAQAGEYPPVQSMPPAYPGARRPPVQRMPQADHSRDAGPATTSSSGALVIRVQPGDADILIDGEPWRGPEGDERLVVQLPEGAHRVDVRKQGYAAFSTEVQVRRGETVPLNVSLSRQ